MTLRLDLTDQDFFREPAARIAELRALGPVIRIKFPIVGKVWITTNYEMAGRVLKDSGTFTLRKEGCRPSLVDAAHRPGARQQHAHHGRARPHKIAKHRR
jgi:hypothetical protein